MKRNAVTLFNTAAPLFLLLFRPRLWLTLAPANLLIDAAALYVSLRAMGLAGRFAGMLRRELWLMWAMGIAADLAGAGILRGLTAIPGAAGGAWAAIVSGVLRNPFGNTNALLLLFFAIIVSGMLKYVLNLWVSCRRTALPLKERRTLCLSVALCTAPYTFLLPGLWLSFLG